MKGITPVIAVVLLLLITVGAVGAAFGLFQQLQNQAEGQQDQFSDAQRAANTEIQFDSVYSTTDSVGIASNPRPNTINMTIRNTGQRAINLPADFELRVRPPEESQTLSVDRFNTSYGGEWVQQDYSGFSGTDGTEAINTCFQNTEDTPRRTLPSADTANNTFTCNTGIRFPDPGESITLAVNFVGSESVEFTYTCDPQSAGTTC